MPLDAPTGIALAAAGVAALSLAVPTSFRAGEIWATLRDVLSRLERQEGRLLDLQDEFHAFRTTAARSSVPTEPQEKAITYEEETMEGRP